ncbi:hypothetical protein ACFPM0_28610 [Pseudonocardia sulfidoxydans]|uniref:hypothetical protein n=1 Tax=Pseudonocardia sulfidoxydans TaxID=54011 RepID=UPI003616ACE0
MHALGVGAAVPWLQCARRTLLPRRRCAAASRYGYYSIFVGIVVCSPFSVIFRLVCPMGSAPRRSAGPHGRRTQCW